MLLDWWQQIRELLENIFALTVFYLVVKRQKFHIDMEKKLKGKREARLTTDWAFPVKIDE